MSSSETVERLCSILREEGILAADVELDPGRHLLEDGLTSFDLVRLLITVEDQFDIEFPDDQLSDGVLTLHQIADVVDALVAAPTAVDRP